MSEGRVIIPEGYEQNEEDRVKRLHTTSAGGGNMKISGTIQCPKTDCDRPISFSLRTHDSRRIEFTTTCKRCKAKIELTFITKLVEDETPYEMIEKGQIVKEEAPKENAVEQLPTATQFESGIVNEDKNKQSGDEQGTSSNTEADEASEPDEKNPFAGLE